MAIFIWVFGKVIQCVFIVVANNIICYEIPMELFKTLLQIGALEVVFEITAFRIFKKRKKQQ